MIGLSSVSLQRRMSTILLKSCRKSADCFQTSILIYFNTYNIVLFKETASAVRYEITMGLNCGARTTAIFDGSTALGNIFSSHAEGTQNQLQMETKFQRILIPVYRALCNFFVVFKNFATFSTISRYIGKQIQSNVAETVRQIRELLTDDENRAWIKKVYGEDEVCSTTQSTISMYKMVHL